MLEETQSMVGAQSQEVKRARDEIAALKLLINISLGNLPAEPEKPKELDYYGNPEEAIKQTISTSKACCLRTESSAAEVENAKEKFLPLIRLAASYGLCGLWTFVKDALAKATLDQVTEPEHRSGN